MAWHWPGDNPSSEPRMESLVMHICITRPQWVGSKIYLTLVWHKQNCDTIIGPWKSKSKLIEFSQEGIYEPINHLQNEDLQPVRSLELAWMVVPDGLVPIWPSATAILIHTPAYHFIQYQNCSNKMEEICHNTGSLWGPLCSLWFKFSAADKGIQLSWSITNQWWWRRQVGAQPK